MNERKGSWIQTISGKRFWPLDPRPEDVCIEDIAHALAHICRFNGHCRFLYTVAQHSVYVSRLVPPGEELVGLMHDAAEAYVGDMVRPLKVHMPAYKQAEHLVWKAIAERFQLPYILPASIHEADDAMLLAERDQIMYADNSAAREWTLIRPGVKPAGVVVSFWTCEQARKAFLRRFHDLSSTTTG